MIDRETHGDVTLIRLAHGKANAMDVELLEALGSVADDLRRSHVGAVVVTGGGKIFSGGVDLKRFVDGGAEYAARFVPLLSRVFTAWFALEKPIVAAINGHAIAGGCVLAQVADHRLMARGSGRIGFPELQVGVPFPPAVLEIMRASLPQNRLTEVYLLGKNYEPDEAVTRGLIDAIVEPPDLLAEAMAAASRLAALSHHAVSVTKRIARAPVLRLIARQEREYGPACLAVWQAEETRERVRTFIQRTLK